MTLSSLLNPNLIFLKSDARSIHEAIETALKTIVQHYGHEVDYEDALRRINERHSLGGDSFKTGIAIPHARIPNFNDFIIAAVVPREPIPGDVPIRMVWLMLVSQTTSAMYLNALAKLAECSKDASAMEKLTTAESPERFIGTIEELGYRVKKSLYVADIMTKEVVSVPETATLKDLIDTAYKHGLRYIPVVDASGTLAGEVGVMDIVKAGIPDYAFRIGSLKFLTELEPLSELLANEDKILVKSIMQKAATLPPTASVVEAAFEMTKNRKRHYTVVEDGKIVGVISYTDIFKKVLRA